MRPDINDLPDAAVELLDKLASIARAGPIEAVKTGSTAVGMTLLDALSIAYDSRKKPNFKGIVVNTSRNNSRSRTRVNLFAKVPDWSISECGSSAEIVERYGDVPGNSTKRLFCTVSARSPNSHGLMLRVDSSVDTLDEEFTPDGERFFPVARWNLEKLRDRLTETHPETIWVEAQSLKRDGTEYFHYRKAIYTGAPLITEFSRLLDQGTITVDHLIEKTPRGTKEKGPLFKIKPANISMLFQAPVKVNLLDYSASKC